MNLDNFSNQRLVKELRAIPKDLFKSPARDVLIEGSEKPPVGPPTYQITTTSGRESCWF